jgi:hypothetical protein
MIVSRRAFLASASSLPLAACVTGPNGVYELDPTVIDAIQSAVSTAAQYIPTVESIISLAASLFGPAYASVISIGTTAFNSLVAALTSIVGNLTPPASARLRARLRGSYSGAPVVIGTTHGVTITGFKP